MIMHARSGICVCVYACLVRTFQPVEYLSFDEEDHRQDNMSQQKIYAEEVYDNDGNDDMLLGEMMQQQLQIDEKNSDVPPLNQCYCSACGKKFCFTGPSIFKPGMTSSDRETARKQAREHKRLVANGEIEHENEKKRKNYEKVVQELAKKEAERRRNGSKSLSSFSGAASRLWKKTP